MKINHTKARTDAKKLLGDNNHLLITLLIGVEGVRTGQVTKSDKFNVTWNPKDLESTARRSRRFARAAALAWAVDALDAYLGALSNSKIYDLSVILPEINDQLTQRSVYKKLEAIEDALDLAPSVELSLSHLAIQWRNNLIHSTAENELDTPHRVLIREKLKSDEKKPNSFGNIDGDRLLKDFNNDGHPTFKAVAAFIQSINTLIEVVDCTIISKIKLDSYIDGQLTCLATAERLPNMTRLWGNTNTSQKERGIKCLLNSLGVVDIQPNDSYFQELVALTSAQLRSRFKF